MVAYLIRDMLDKAKSTDTEAMIAALEDLRFDTIVGPAVMRGLDNQSTLGAWVGETALNGRPGHDEELPLRGRGAVPPPGRGGARRAQGLKGAGIHPAAANRGGAI